MEDLISIVIPVYNVENYLIRCLDSVINQTYKNIEIILVDDGSTDISGKICDEYSRKDNRIVVFHNTNNGIAYTRNFGIEKATGKYLTFIDSDDYVDKDYINFLHNTLIQYNCDIATCSNIKFKKNEENIKCNKNNQKVEYLLLNKEEALKSMLYQNNLDSSLWGKIYKTNTLKQIKIPNYHVFEDFAYLYNLLNNTNRIVVSNNNLYFYYIRKNSLIHNNITQNAKIIKEILSNIEKETTDYDIIKAINARKMDANFNELCNSKIGSNEYRNAKKRIINKRKEILNDSNISKKTRYAILISYISFVLVKLIYLIRK